MLFHDAVGITCEKGAATENQAQMSSIGAKAFMLMIVFVFSDLT